MTRGLFAAIVALPLVTPWAAWADTRSDVLIAIGQCERFKDDRAWLDCIDAAEQPLRLKLGAPAPSPTAPARIERPSQEPQPADEATRRFGLRLPRLPSPPTDAGVRARMTDYRFDRFGIFTVTLDNGQVWRQIDGDTSVAHWSKPAASYVAIVRNGALKSFNLTVEGEGGAYKVLRAN